MTDAERTLWIDTLSAAATLPPDLTSRRVHLFGPDSMMDSAKVLLAELGLPAHHLKTWAFGLVKHAAAIQGFTPQSIGPATGPTVTFSKHDKLAKIHIDLRQGTVLSCRRYLS